MTFRYDALLTSLRSLRGEPPISIAPTEAAVRYREPRRGIAPLADVYHPARPSGRSVVLVHGGAFVIGSRRMKPMRLLAARLVEAGLTVCAVDYRMMFRGGRLDEAIADVTDAVEFWRARSTGEISLVGLSAGASIALGVAARSPHVARLVCAFGLYEVDHLRGIASVFPRLLFGTADRTAWTARSPRHLPQPTTPTLLLHGTEDGLVPVDQARRLAAHREALGLPTRLVIYEGAPHGFFNLPCDAAEAGVREIVSHVA